MINDGQYLPPLIVFPSGLFLQYLHFQFTAFLHDAYIFSKLRCLHVSIQQGLRFPGLYDGKDISACGALKRIIGNTTLM